MTELDTTEAVANAMYEYGNRHDMHRLKLSPGQDLYREAEAAIQAHRQELKANGVVEVKTVKVSMYGNDGLYNLATDPDTAPESYEADSVMFWLIERLQSLGLPIELDES